VATVAHELTVNWIEMLTLEYIGLIESFYDTDIDTDTNASSESLTT